MVSNFGHVEKSINGRMYICLLRMALTVAGIRFQVKEELEKRFREAAMKRFGFGKGSLSRAAEEAIENWLTSFAVEDVKFEGDPVEAIDGLLANVKVDSVELQHLVKKLWMEEVLSNVSR